MKDVKEGVVVVMAGDRIRIDRLCGPEWVRVTSIDRARGTVSVIHDDSETSGVEWRLNHGMAPA